MRLLVTALVSLSLLTACQNEPASVQSSTTDASFYLDGQQLVVQADNYRFQQLVLHSVNADQRPIMPPLSASLAYDESRTADVRAAVDGRVSSADYAQLGKEVRAGDTLVTLTSSDLIDALAELEKAQANQQLAKSQYDRARLLYEAKALARKELEEAQEAWQQANTDVKRGQQFLQRLGVTAQQARQHNGTFAVQSPINGVITEVNLRPGMEVHHDDELPMYVVADLSQLWLWVDVFEKDISQVQLGQPIRATVSAWPEEEFVGEIDYISRVVNPDTRAIRVRCLLDNQTQKLLPAMHAQVSILNANPQQAALSVPLTAVVTEGDQQFVFVREGEHHFRWQAIELGTRFAKHALVKQGLTQGEQIVSDGALALRRDMLLLLSNE